MSIATTDRKVIDAYAVALNRTSDYNIEPEDRRYIARILEGYVFDRNQPTHCCELTPSYWLIYLFTSVELTDAGLALDDDARGDLYDRYEMESSDDCYIHCRVVNRIIEKMGPAYVCHYGDTARLEDDLDDLDDLDARHDAELEHIREHLSANHPF